MSLPTFEEWTKNMSLTDQIKFHYDVEIINPNTNESNFTGDPWRIVGEIAEDCPNWLKQFNKEFEENLREREYIR